MKLINDNNFKMSLDTQYNHVLEHPFTVLIYNEKHTFYCDVFAECDIDGNVISFSVSCIDEDDYTESQLDEIDNYLTSKLKENV